MAYILVHFQRFERLQKPSRHHWVQDASLEAQTDSDGSDLEVDISLDRRRAEEKQRQYRSKHGPKRNKAWWTCLFTIIQFIEVFNGKYWQQAFEHYCRGRDCICKGDISELKKLMRHSLRD